MLFYILAMQLTRENKFDKNEKEKKTRYQTLILGSVLGL
jgi:hypothetical protein